MQTKYKQGTCKPVPILHSYYINLTHTEWPNTPQSTHRTADRSWNQPAISGFILLSSKTMWKFQRPITNYLC